MNLPDNKMVLQGASAILAGAAAKQASSGDIRGAVALGVLSTLSYGASRIVEIEIEKGEWKIKAKFTPSEA